jgi:hypothetical protein
MVLFGELMSGRAVYDRNLRQYEPAIDDVEPAAEPVHPESAEADLAHMPEPDFVPAPVAAPVAPPPPVVLQHRPDGLSTLAADMALGRARLILLAAISEARDSAVVADTLVGEALQKGLSVCRIDAGSGRLSSGPGLTDLCAEQASFGDVVHKVRDGLAEVPWGRLPTMDRRSMKPLTLAEALADIYEVVIVSTGRIGLNSSLPVFAGLPARLVMVRQDGTPAALVEAVSADAASIGFGTVDSVLVPEPQSAVA